jgi:hypothetical protein
MFEISAVATNAMNTPEWYNSLDNSKVSTATFGKIAGVKGMTNSPRGITLGARLRF